MKVRTALPCLLRNFSRTSTTLREAIKVTEFIVGAAGPVLHGKVNFTNSDWVIDIENIKNLFQREFSSGCLFGLINDFEALAYGLALIQGNDY